MFSSGPSYTKLKTNLRLAINRLKLLEKKKTELALKQRKEIADYISGGKVERAKIRVEHIIREDYMVEAMEILEMYCDLLLARFGLIQQMKAIDDGLAEAISSIIWVAPRLQADVQELKIIADQLAAKYGKEYALACRGNNVGTVSEKLCHKLNVQAPPKLTVEKYLIEIAKYYNVEYEPDPQILQGDEAFAADHLIDLGPAPPLPDKNDFNGGGGNAVPPMPSQPFQYPPQQPATQPFSYPPQGGAEAYPPPGAAAYPPAASPYPPPGAPQGAAYPYPQRAGEESSGDKGLMGFEEGPPPYFPPDVNSPTSVHSTSNPTTPSVQAPAQAPAPAPSSIQPPATNTNQNTSNDDDETKKNFEDCLDLPELPGVPLDTPTTENASTNDKDDEDIDFDDLTRRFEALKKKK